MRATNALLLQGLTKPPALAAVLGAVVHAPLNWLIIHRLGFGVFGAAIATSVNQIFVPLVLLAIVSFRCGETTRTRQSGGGSGGYAAVPTEHAEDTTDNGAAAGDDGSGWKDVALLESARPLAAAPSRLLGRDAPTSQPSSASSSLTTSSEANLLCWGGLSLDEVLSWKDMKAFLALAGPGLVSAHSNAAKARMF